MDEPSTGIDFHSYIRGRSDRNRYDLTHLLAQPQLFAPLVEQLAQPFLHMSITKVAALDAFGFALGGGVAHRLSAGLILVRKGGKVAWSVESASFTDYSGLEKTLEIASDAASPADKVLLVDDWSETGAQLRTAIALVERLGAEVVGAACIHIEAPVCKDPILAKYRLHSVLEQ
jgi:adenine phosphoribosyltransferase